MKEADIEISGHKLSEGQSMTLRVALQIFAITLQDGEDKATQLTQNYLARIREMNELIALTAR